MANLNMGLHAIVGEKVGMTQTWVDDKVVPVTVVKVEPMRIVQIKTTERDGYTAIQVTYGSKDAKTAVATGKRLVELHLDSVDGLEVGQEIGVDSIKSGARVDVTLTSRGKGFAGVMKRHNFKGASASHGAHKNHRKPGAIGQSAFPVRASKAAKMAGGMELEYATTLDVEIVESDKERNILLIKGTVPGPAGGVVTIRNAVKLAGARRRSETDPSQSLLDDNRLAAIDRIDISQFALPPDDSPSPL